MTNNIATELESIAQLVTEVAEDSRKERQRFHAEVMDALNNPRLFDKAERLIDLEKK